MRNPRDDTTPVKIDSSVYFTPVFGQPCFEGRAGNAEVATASLTENGDTIFVSTYAPIEITSLAQFLEDASAALAFCQGRNLDAEIDAELGEPSQ
jgi:hypothetical protein